LADRDAFLVRLDPKVLEALRRWARDELRSVNGQIEYLLRRALSDAGRLGAATASTPASGSRPPDASDG